MAICIQHEMDHLEGVLFIDHLSRLKRTRRSRRSRNCARPPDGPLSLQRLRLQHCGVARQTVEILAPLESAGLKHL